MDVTSARDFYMAFRNDLDAGKSPWFMYGNNNLKWTEWFELSMLRLAKQFGVYCKNKQSVDSKGKEWLSADNVFIKENAYNRFPLVVVEHENRDLQTSNGAIPHPDAGGIEWAFWKSLAIRCDLSVTVCYPYKHQQSNAITVLGNIAQGWYEHHQSEPNVLVVFGWWAPGNRPIEPNTIYEAYVSHMQNGKVCFQLIS